MVSNNKAGEEAYEKQWTKSKNKILSSLQMVNYMLKQTKCD